jgi:hypothetical protein
MTRHRPMNAPSTENLVVHPFGPYLAALHLQDLLDEAALERRARRMGKGNPGVPAWRRSLGGALANAARSLDPSVDVPIREARPTESRGARAAA